MKIIIESTDKIVQLTSTAVGSIPARIWEGHTESGIQVHCYITRVAISEDEPADVKAFFEKELQEQRKPSAEIAAIPLRLII